VEFIEYLRDKGARASRTHFDPKGLKTDLEASELLEHYKRYHKKR